MNIPCSKKLPVVILPLTLLLSACGSDNDPVMVVTPPAPEPTPVNVSYEVTVTNATAAQPLSPIGVVLHDSDNLWQLGTAASTELETMAESGDNSQLLGLDIVTASTSGEAPLGPGQSETFTVTITDKTDSYLSVVSMLVNTNDAFTGLNGVSLAGLSVGDSWQGTSMVYDAGTEANSETAETIPGPAGGGAGYDEMRDDVDFIAVHPGVVSADDGLATSALTSEHRFDNPAIRISITRTE